MTTDNSNGVSVKALSWELSADISYPISGNIYATARSRTGIPAVDGQRSERHCMLLTCGSM
ncbi:hypothetical protein [Nocardia beijingensis]|uniref:hypothetical protein n=1 Tax=Nocardia beijingensis TaxID=95162 RepID=UPI0033FFCFE2